MINKSILLLAVIFMISCGSKTEKQASSATETTTAQATAVVEAAEPALPNYLDLYIKIKDALINGNSDKAQKISTHVVQKLDLPSEEIKQGFAEIAIVGTLKEQRSAFSKLSNSLYAHAKTIDLAGVTLYQQFCPMAFNNEGAYWLSDESEIRNPYFGAQMMHCGSVQDTLK